MADPLRNAAIYYADDGYSPEKKGVNGRRVDVPSYQVKVGEEIEVKDTTVSRQLATRGMESSTSRPIPEWVTRNKESYKGSLVRVPTLAEIQPVANEQAVIEFYSR